MKVLQGFRKELIIAPIVTIVLAYVMWRFRPWNLISLAKLQEWQTFMAAMVALFAAALAYRGAMVKIDFDRQQAAAAIAQKRLGAFLRLRYALENLEYLARDMRTSIQDNIDQFTEEKSIPDRYSKIGDVPELDEAWEKLELFAPVGVAYIGKTRQAVRDYSRILEDIKTVQSFGRLPRLREKPCSQAA
jgi:hypothetical protein